MVELLQVKDYRLYFMGLDYTSAGDKVPYDITKNKAQQDFHGAEAQFKAMFGGSGLGKSMGAAREAERYIIANKREITTWIVSPSYELSEKEFKYIYEDLVITQGFKPDKIRYNVRSGDLYMKFPWGPEIMGKSEGDPNSLLGEAVQVLILGEGARLKQETWERYLRRAVARGEGAVICNTTPKGFNWVYDTFYLPSLSNQGKKYYWSGIYDVLENPYYSRDEYNRAQTEIGEEIFQEQFQGKFVQYSGLIYPEFDYKRHLHPIEIAALPKEFPLVCHIDVHPSMPTAVLWALNDNERCSIYADELWTHGLVSDVCELIYGRSKVHRRIPQLFIIDTIDKEDVRSGINFMAEFKYELERAFKSKVRCKTPNRSSKVNENAHIFHIKERLKGFFEYPVVRMEPIARQKPWVTIADHCKQFRYELEHCCWDKNRQIENKNNHFLDLMKHHEAEVVPRSEDRSPRIYNRMTRQYRGTEQERRVG